jgi:hypothetical protein
MAQAEAGKPIRIALPAPGGPTIGGADSRTKMPGKDAGQRWMLPSVRRHGPY